MGNFPVYLTEEARERFVNTLLNKINETEKSLSKEQLEQFVRFSNCLSNSPILLRRSYDCDFRRNQLRQFQRAQDRSKNRWQVYE